MRLEYVAEWFKFADRDLSSAEYLLPMYPKPLEIICYLCQQSVEKYLKGFLVHNGIDEPAKTHDLILLQTECEKFDNRFTEIGQVCDVLTRYGVQPRYPNEILIIEKDMEKALEYAQKIRAFEPLAELREKFAIDDSVEG